MAEIDHFCVTVSRVNESANVDPYISINGHSLTVSSDGSLYVVGEHESRGFSAGRPEVTKRSSDTHKRTKQEHEARSVRETKGFQSLSGSLGIGGR